MTADPTPIPEQPTAPRTAAGRTLLDNLVRLATTILGPEEYPPAATDQFLREVLAIEAEAAASVPAPEQEEAVRLAAAELLDLIYHGPQPSLGWLKRRAEVAHLQDAVRRAALATADVDEEGGNG